MKIGDRVVFVGLAIDGPVGKCGTMIARNTVLFDAPFNGHCADDHQQQRYRSWHVNPDQIELEKPWTPIEQAARDYCNKELSRA